MKNSIKDNLIEKLEKNQALITIIGLGYVGLPLALNYSEKGYKVLGLDIDESKINSLKKGISYINSISEERVKNAIFSSSLEVSTDYAKIKNADALIICVPTPLNKNKGPDLKYILNTMQFIGNFLRPGQVISLESTTYPGTTEEELRPFIENKGFVIGKDIFLIYSPEREDPGNKKYNTSSIPKVMGGSTNECSEVGKALYYKVTTEVVEVSSTKVAELTKLLENIHRSVNIGLINELKPLADRMGIDIYEVIKAASTKPFGFVPYYPGPGLGGHCIPIDPFYLTYKAHEYGMHTRFIELAGEINEGMPAYIVDKTTNALNEIEKPLKGSKVLILGMAYKKNVDDIRESPSLKIMNLLKQKHANVSYNDPYIKVIPITRNSELVLESIDLNEENLRSFDAVILATDHDSYEYDMIEKNSNLIIDTRGKFPLKENIIRA